MGCNKFIIDRVLEKPGACLTRLWFGSPPGFLRSDNGLEVASRAVHRWLTHAGAKTLCVAPASPWENGYVESFNEKLRDELSNRELFLRMDELRYFVERWRMDYNHYRPHSSRGYMSPAAFAASLSLWRLSRQDAFVLFLPFLQDSDLLIEVLNAPLRSLTFQMPARDAHGENPQPDSRRQGNGLDIGLELHVVNRYAGYAA